MDRTDFEFLRELAAMRPVTADPAAVDRVQYRMKEFLDANGLFTTVEAVEDRHLVYASTNGSKTPDILFNAHLDVVPASDEAQYTLVERDGKIFGRGPADDLGNAICIARTLIALKGKVSAGAIFTGNEECGGSTTNGMIDLGYGAKKMVVIADGNAGPERVVYAQKGIVTLKLTAHGRSGHSSMPWNFDNAIEKLLAGYAKFASTWDNPRSIDDWRSTMAPCIISGGQAVNQIPGEATLFVNFRVVTNEEFETLADRVRKVTGLEVEFFRGCRPYTGDPNAPEMRLLGQVIRELCGIETEFARMTGATDARHLQRCGVPVAIIGCKGAGAHSIGEYLETDAIDRMLAIFTELARRL